jgi:hypothetical protein
MVSEGTALEDFHEILLSAFGKCVSIWAIWSYLDTPRTIKSRLMFGRTS